MKGLRLFLQLNRELVAVGIAIATVISIVTGMQDASHFVSGPGSCVIEHCAEALAKCEIDTVCRTWSACTQACKDLKCQLRCGDLYKPTDSTSDQITAFSECVISEHHCVPQVNMTCKIPSNADTLKPLDLADVEGTWYISGGWNPEFDCFDCQVHDFTLNSSGPKPLQGDLRYAVKTDLNCSTDSTPCNYLPREVHQGFVPHGPIGTPASAHLENHNNTLAELHYADDWWVLAHAANRYVLVYYCGCNDATCGYSGSVLYTRSPLLSSLSNNEMTTIQNATKAANVPNYNLANFCHPNATACE